jgi:hypothetical protein
MNGRLLLLMGWLMLTMLALTACDNNSSSTATPITPTPNRGLPISASPGVVTLPPTTTLPRALLSPTTGILSGPTSTPLSSSLLLASATVSVSATATAMPLSTNLTPAPTATLIVDGLILLVLQPNEAPAGLTQDPTRSGEQSNETVADGDDTRLQQLKSWTRQTGYIAVYQSASTALTGTISLLSSSAAFYATATGASAAWADAVSRLKGGLPLTEVAAAPHYGTQSVVLAYTDPSTNIVTLVIVVASGQLVAEVSAVGEQLSPASLYPLAQIVAARLPH